MSTTFKIIENHIENSRTSPKKSVALASSHLSPSSRANDSQDGSQSFDKEEVLKLEIKQLQRENKFLKKKIVELTAQLNGDSQQPKKKTVSGKGAPKQDIDPTHMTIDFFFKQINSLMNSLADLFRIEFTNEFSVHDESVPANKRYVMYKKFTLTRKLQKITLQPEERRYSSLLDVFTHYYKAKEECDRFLRETVDQLSVRVLQLNKMILGHASKKKNSMKGSCIKSVYTVEDSNDKSDKNVLTLPWSLKPISASPSDVLSFTDESTKKKIDFN